MFTSEKHLFKLVYYILKFITYLSDHKDHLDCYYNCLKTSNFIALEWTLGNWVIKKKKKKKPLADA